jgi:hypothetical protein
MFALAFCLSGCVGFVAGDLRNTKSDCRIPTCKNGSADYEITYKSDAKDDYGDKNIAGFLSHLTLGIVPTYWTTTVYSEATILHNGTTVYTKTYKSRIHEFYGWLWLILPSHGVNVIQANEGTGLEIEGGIRDRTLCKIVADHGGKEGQYCLKKDDNL